MLKSFIGIIALIGLQASAANVDMKASVFKWTGSKKITGDKHHGKIFLKEAKLDRKEGQFIGGSFVMNMKTFTCEDIENETYRKKFLTHVKSGDFFEVEKYPVATLKIDKVDQSKLSGKLTIKDKTHPVSFPYTKEGNEYKGTLKFDRTKYGIIYRSGNFFKDLGDKVISDEVQLEFKVVVK